ncbi:MULTISPECIES: hypothetical protein [unclassified Haladaptatus]|uniref:hypothetical protein n=1 Tax=unclassified Haladaptatus TaxID=2622732 RepID=UPI0023E7DBA1|nr:MULTISPECIES: hypothetical protein [unclassified Haladaptatus]
MDTAGIQRALVAEYSETIRETLRCADAVSEAWPDESVRDREHLVEPFRALLTDRGVLSTYPAMLATAVEAGGETMQAQPVAAPPYVVVTSTGPLLRATLPAGRLVIRIEAFDVVGSGPPTYRRAKSSPDAALSVDYR